MFETAHHSLVRRCNLLSILRKRIDRRSGMARKLIRTGLLLAAIMMAGAVTSHAQISIGIRIGRPPRPRVVRVLPPRPGPEFVWVAGYWYPVGRHYRWHVGYWTRPPYAGARWVGPHYDGGEFFEGYWNGDRGRVEHDHRWDKDRDRDREWDRGDHHDDRHEGHGKDHRDDRH